MGREDLRPKTRVEEGIKDRHGNILTRRSNIGHNPFELPEEFIEAIHAENYSIEWKTELVHNQHRSTYVAALMDNHWTPVLNERLPGRYPGEPNEPIRHDGLMLMERPMGLTIQARREDDRAAREQVYARKRDWGVDSKRRDLFDPSTPDARAHTLLRSTSEQAPASWSPELTVAAGDEF